MPLPPAGDIAIVVAGALVAGFVNGLTGFGTALFMDGRLQTHLEIAHHPFRKGKTYVARAKKHR